MTRDEVIRMAREAGVYDGAMNLYWCGVENIERFAALVAAREREECARLCDKAHERMNSTFQGAAAAIRARGAE